MKTQEHRSSPLKSHTQSEYRDNNMQSFEAHLLGSLIILLQLYSQKNAV